MKKILIELKIDEDTDICRKNMTTQGARIEVMLSKIEFLRVYFCHFVDTEIKAHTWKSQFSIKAIGRRRKIYLLASFKFIYM